MLPRFHYLGRMKAHVSAVLAEHRKARHSLEGIQPVPDDGGDAEDASLGLPSLVVPAGGARTQRFKFLQLGDYLFDGERLIHTDSISHIPGVKV